MPRVTCPQGHVWEDTAPPGVSAVCPQCGTQIQTPSAEPDATVLLGHAKSNPGMFAFPNIPDFHVESEIGRGGMGIVYRAKQLSTGNIVAVKVIRKDRLQHDEAVRRFRREAQAAARLDHPNIVRVFDSDHSGDVHYLLMEYVPGITLERYVADRGPLPIPLACASMRQVASGLEHAHRQGIIHRDIKPSNLMISPALGDAPAQVKVLDMGVARLLQPEGLAAESGSFLTMSGVVLGTADYVSPEQLDEPHRADLRADLYSLGCTFYFLLAGDVPFPGGTLLSKLDKQRWKTPRPLRELRPEIPPALAEVVEKLMAKKASDRYQTPMELVAALEELARTDYASHTPKGPALTEMSRLAGDKDVVCAVAFAPADNLAASGGRDRIVRIWNATTGKEMRAFPKTAQEIRALAFSNTGQRLAFAAGVTVRLVDPRLGVELRRFSGHSDVIRQLLFADDDRRLYSASDDRSIRAWDVGSGKEVQRFMRHTAGVTGVVLTAESWTLISGSRDQTIRWWDVRSGQETRNLNPQAGAILGLALSPAGVLASAHFDTVIRLWDVATGAPLGELHGHKQMVTAVAFAPDGRTLFSAGQDQTLRWWNPLTGLELSCLSLEHGGVHSLAIAPAGDRGLAADDGAGICLFAIPQARS